MDHITELELQGLLDRDRIMALMNRYFATVDDASGLDAEWARSIFSEDVRVEHRGFTLEGIEDLAVGNRFVRDGWDRTFHVSTNAQVELDGDSAHLRASYWPFTYIQSRPRRSRTSSPTCSKPMPSAPSMGGGSRR